MKEKYKPIVGITIGDPAGIGPEIILKALGEKHIYDECRPLVIGCVNVLERAKAVLPQCSLEFNRIESVSDACFRFGSIDVLETGHYDISKLVCANGIHCYLSGGRRTDSNGFHSHIY